MNHPNLLPLLLALAPLSLAVAAGWSVGGCSEPPDHRYTQIATGRFHSCALNLSGEIACWGCGDDKDFGQCDPPDGSFFQVTAGNKHTCALTSDQEIVCWGTPYLCGAPAGTFIHVDSGAQHSCAVATGGGAVMCWGNNVYGQLTSPVGSFSQVSAGRYHSCALAPDGTIECWGCRVGGEYGQCDALDDSFVHVESGDYTTYALKADGSIERWGCEDYDEYSCGDSTTTGGPYSQVSAGGGNLCRIKIDGALELDCSSILYLEDPAELPIGEFAQASIHEYHGCAVRTNNTAACWGWAGFGAIEVPGE